MARRRMSRFSRLSASSHKGAGRIVPIVISVVAFLSLSVIISVAVGLLLSDRVDELDEKKKFEFEKVEYISGSKTVKSVEAYHFSEGSSPYDYASQGIRDLSVMARDSEGALHFAFEIADTFPIDEVRSERSFKALCEDARGADARVCAYVYIISFEIGDKYARDTAKAYEIALISELAASGADDILLLGLSVTEENLGEVCDFVSRASLAAGKAPLGVALSPEVFYLAGNEVYTAGRVRGCCDYLAVDLTYLTLEDGQSPGTAENGEELPSLLEKTVDRLKFYISEYPARVLFARENHKLYVDATELGVVDYQIVDK